MFSKWRRDSVETSEPLSALTHGVGALLAISALVLLIVFGALRAGPAHVVGFSIFGTSLILLYAMSALYHFFPKNSHKKELLQRVDHAMIFLFIAGSYTPICLTMPSRAWGWSLFGVIWALALCGFVLKILAVKMPPWFSAMLYLAMGWLVLLALGPLWAWLQGWAFFWLFLGGVFYSFGAGVFILESLQKNPKALYFGLHELFHLFVMMGSFCHFWLMLHYITPAS